MSFRSIALVVVAVLALVACGPSSAQIKTAREARYRASASEVFQAAVGALKTNDHKIKQADPVAGRALTEPRWYEVDGTTLSRDSDGRPQLSSAGGIMLSIEVGVVPDGETFRVEVIPRVLQQKDGYSAPLELKPGDPAMPGWIAGKVDNVYISTYDTLKKSAVLSGT
ncbi:MAG: hypothetical protein IPL61_29395 [Myxococcales bacterium]|nr:hypothetical protein [Myxococcales bacterium]